MGALAPGHAGAAAVGTEVPLSSAHFVAELALLDVAVTGSSARR